MNASEKNRKIQAVIQAVIVQVSLISYKLQSVLKIAESEMHPKLEKLRYFENWGFFFEILTEFWNFWVFTSNKYD